MDLRLRPSEPQRVRLGALGLDVEIAAGEELRVEISAKFRPDRFVEELAELGFGARAVWHDHAAEFALVLAERV
jgi:L-histidine N-alpha-methyltransferase